jgi:D-arabinose 1-dehydrogenase-like Zn-dependent alcohol dehydrogenase
MDARIDVRTQTRGDEATVRAALMSETGGPSVLRLQDVDRPEPAPNEVLLEVAACGMCGHDQADRMGLTTIPLPEILGHEIAGTVVEVGSKVQRFQVGDRVAKKQFTTCGHCAACLAGREIQCAQRIFNYGGFAEYVTARESTLLPVPDGVDLAAASVVACAVGTCLQALRRIARVQPGETVVVTGAGGGLGLHGVQVAAALGATVIAITSTADKAAQLSKIGAAHVITTDTADYWKKILNVTEGRGAEVVLDNVGHPKLFSQCFRGLAHAGRYVFTGQVGAERVSFFPAFVFAKEAVITGSASTSMSTFVDSMALVADGLVIPVVETYPLDDVVRAFEDLDARRVVGRAVIVPAAG